MQKEYKTTKEKNIQVSNVSTIDDQSPSMQAQKQISAINGIVDVKAVNIGNNLYVAAKPTQFKRLQLNSLRDEISKQLKASFPTYQYHISLDSKIYKLVGQLQNDVNKKEVNAVVIAKKAKKIESEMNSDT
ncbi:YhcN/YlaJ family sporulation lipoprotein [Ectobacillus polymachus]|uniref:YhcN/YlaJ family sporulation lipoprotein n=1 Tax=Ectobacillus polymachus TaxID=1508806 RepID=UPI003A84C6BF